MTRPILHTKFKYFFGIPTKTLHYGLMMITIIDQQKEVISEIRLLCTEIRMSRLTKKAAPSIVARNSKCWRILRLRQSTPLIPTVSTVISKNAQQRKKSAQYPASLKPSIKPQDSRTRMEKNHFSAQHLPVRKT